ncbi:Putative L-ornithine N5-oxygenase SidA [[Torrubiella] hemipterigena]|uniref:L-ornithine N(5)-monooxygenase [NAD(P)H] n=1 Tax=[Torrubiella] hemipterigena TaxID=1531966 RepID=A0A0A1T1H4_9HYPO|nr:Putative L-ornithine N5-oxygenase SidA [[Torrubiella] hemipterigena]
MSPHTITDSHIEPNGTWASTLEPVSNGAVSHDVSTNGNGHGAETPAVNGNGGAVTAHQIPAARRMYDNKSRHLDATPLDDEFDLVCVGFGPASLAIAVALHDAMESGKKLRPNGAAPKVLFIEKQNRFAWHAGMLLPGAKMQISFVKDLATLRDPRSEFTFLNYLHQQDRLVDFTNLGTFLPARVEYEDYLRWCSSFFSHLVQFNEEVLTVSPVKDTSDPVNQFVVQSQNAKTGHVQTYKARNVLLATGGRPSFPKSFPLKHPQIIHSSQYAYMVPQLLTQRNKPYKVAVVGAGQSAAEIFHNIHHLYPNSQTWLVMRQEFLKPSDDSPFVNSIFNPEYIDSLFPKSAKDRSNFLADARATNYGVVRLELIEELYTTMYDQRRDLGPDETNWPHRILGGREITNIDTAGDKVQIKVQQIRDGAISPVAGPGEEELLDADLIIAATGYQRNAHIDMLKGTWDMLPKASPGSVEFAKGVTGWNVSTDQGERKLAVGRDYRVNYTAGQVAGDAGIWLQGCCEGTHGLSDTLLSVLATRSGEMVESIFKPE